MLAMRRLRCGMADKVHDLRSFMIQATNEISAEYRRIYASSAGDPGTAGDEGEENWANLFRDWLPANYHVATKGQLLAADGRLSPQVDIVVLDPAYPVKLREKRKWLASGVLAAFECKNTLTAAHVTAAVERCTRFKALYTAQTGSPQRELTSKLIYGLLAHSHSWKGADSDPISNIERAANAADQNVTHPRDLIDVICVADLATWATGHITAAHINLIPEEWRGLFQAAFGGIGGVTTTRYRFDEAQQLRDDGFTPLGALIGAIARRLAAQDPNSRRYLDYIGITGGNGTGFQRPWSFDVYTAETLRGIKEGRVRNGGYASDDDYWAGWNLAGP